MSRIKSKKAAALDFELIPVEDEELSPAELVAIEHGRLAFASGDYISLIDLIAHVESLRTTRR